jgi:hypothetical protein
MKTKTCVAIALAIVTFGVLVLWMRRENPVTKPHVLILQEENPQEEKTVRSQVSATGTALEMSPQILQILEIVSPNKLSTRAARAGMINDMPPELRAKLEGQRAPLVAASVEAPRYTLVEFVNNEPFITHPLIITTNGATLRVQYYEDGPITEYVGPQAIMFPKSVLPDSYWLELVRTNALTMQGKRRQAFVKGGGQ